MIFKIADGREYFYQWDIDRQIIVDDPTITEVHFCNRTDNCSLVVEVVDGVANVPNKLLQNGYSIRVFGYDGKATMHEATFEVKARTQPADYVYTETVVKSIDEILEAAETVTTTANEFYEFVEDHTLSFTDDGEGNVDLVAVDCEVDLSEYYTKTEVNELIENIDIPETDLTGYATEEYVDAAVKNIEIDESKFASKDHSHAYSSLTDKPVIPSIEGLASEEYVDEAVKNVKVDVDLTDYAKKTDIPDVSKFITSIPDEYVTETELNAKGYLTEHQSLEGYATEKYVDDAIAAIEIPEGGGGGDGKPLYQHTVYLTSNATSTAEGFKAPSFYTTFVCGRAEAFTFASFADYLYSTGSKLAVSGTLRYAGYYSASPAPIDSVYAVSKTELKLVHRKTSENADEIAEISVNSSNLSSFTDTIVLIGAASVVEGGDADLSNYYTKEETYSKTEVDGLIPEPTDLTNYYTKSEVDEAIQTALNAIGVAEGGAY